MGTRINAYEYLSPLAGHKALDGVIVIDHSLLLARKQLLLNKMLLGDVCIVKILPPYTRASILIGKQHSLLLPSHLAQISNA